MAVTFSTEYEIDRPVDVAKQWFFAFTADGMGDSVAQSINPAGEYVEVVKEDGTTVTSVTRLDATATGGTKVSSSVSMDLGKTASPLYETFSQQAVDAVPPDQQRASMVKVAKRFEAFIDKHVALGGPTGRTL